MGKFSFSEDIKILTKEERADRIKILYKYPLVTPGTSRLFVEGIIEEEEVRRRYNERQRKIKIKR